MVTVFCYITYILYLMFALFIHTILYLFYYIIYVHTINYAYIIVQHSQSYVEYLYTHEPYYCMLWFKFSLCLSIPIATSRVIHAGAMSLSLVPVLRVLIWPHCSLHSLSHSCDLLTLVGTQLLHFDIVCHFYHHGQWYCKFHSRWWHLQWSCTMRRTSSIWPRLRFKRDGIHLILCRVIETFDSSDTSRNTIQAFPISDIVISIVGLHYLHYTYSNICVLVYSICSIYYAAFVSPSML